MNSKQLREYLLSEAYKNQVNTSKFSRKKQKKTSPFNNNEIEFFSENYNLNNLYGNKYYNPDEK